MTVGSISSGSVSIPIIAAQTPVGFIDDQALPEEELLLTPGVSGRRWRTLFTQFPSFEMTTFSEASDYNQAIIIKRQAENFRATLARLQVIVSAQTYAYRDVHVSAVRAICHPGPIYGADTSTNLAHVEIIWSLEMTAFPIGVG